MPKKNLTQAFQSESRHPIIEQWGQDAKKVT
jgi:hypothetical protein